MNLFKIAARVALGVDPHTPAVPGSGGTMIVKLHWLEPEEGSWVVSVTDATEAELREIQAWAQGQAGDAWGDTIPSIRLSPGKAKSPERVSLEDFASAIRYNTGEDVYAVDCPVFAKRGIARS